MAERLEDPGSVLLGGLDQDVDVAGGAGAAPELERPGADEEVPRLCLIEMIADLGLLRSVQGIRFATIGLPPSTMTNCRAPAARSSRTIASGMVLIRNSPFP